MLKDYLVARGPDDWALRAALSLNARVRGFRLLFLPEAISISRGAQEMILPKNHFVQVPIMMQGFQFYFETVQSAQSRGRTVLDFSKPGLHRYKRSSVEFFFPSVPEDDVMNAYTFWYTPQPGDIVWDVGAYAGASSFFFSKMVGPQGKVYAFEPDESNYAYLQKNIDLHHLANVVPVRKALDRNSGRANFVMDGTMSAAIGDYMSYGNGRSHTPVSTLSIPDACSEFGAVPQYIKMDIEGAEIAVIEGATDFLKSNSIHFAIESHHPVEGVRSYKALERIFASIGYQHLSQNYEGQMFTWARPAD